MPSGVLLVVGRKPDFFGLPPQLKLELQYAVQCRADQATITLPPPIVTWTIRQAREAGVSSLLDHSAQWWADRAGPKTSSYPAFLAFARDAVEMLHEGTGWEVEYPRDVWRLERLPGLTTTPGKAYTRDRLLAVTLDEDVGVTVDDDVGSGISGSWSGGRVKGDGFVGNLTLAIHRRLPGVTVRINGGGRRRSRAWQGARWRLVISPRRVW